MGLFSKKKSSPPAITEFYRCRAALEDCDGADFKSASRLLSDEVESMIAEGSAMLSLREQYLRHANREGVYHALEAFYRLALDSVLQDKQLFTNDGGLRKDGLGFQCLLVYEKIVLMAAVMGEMSQERAMQTVANLLEQYHVQSDSA